MSSDTVALLTLIAPLLARAGGAAYEYARPKGAQGARRAKNASSGSARGMTPLSRADLAVKPPGNTVNVSVPKQVSNQIVWDVVKFDQTLTFSTSVVFETNFSFSLSSHPQAASWQALFDQWCIPQASVTFASNLPPGTTTAPGRLYTALDFDNTTNISTIQALEDFATAEVSTMDAAGRMVVRSIRPCNKTSGSPGTYTTRSWCDSGAPASSWYGIRSILSVAGSTYTITATTCIWYAFRNQI